MNPRTDNPINYIYIVLQKTTLKLKAIHYFFLFHFFLFFYEDVGSLMLVLSTFKLLQNFSLLLKILPIDKISSGITFSEYSD